MKLTPLGCDGSVGARATILLSVVALACGDLAAQTANPFDWRSDWAVEGGLAIQVDSEGFEFPSAIAFVPQPGPDPRDPLYFVTELRGRIRVVTNDRSVLTFAEDFVPLEPGQELPAESGEIGLAGICLAPEHGYLFVTFAYEDAEGVVRNNVTRFETRPGTFAVAPEASVSFTEVFAGDRAAVSHQIGPCEIDRDHLFVGVGEGGQPYLSRRTDSTLGKILRMDLDGQPIPDNPFYHDDSTTNPANYVWAYGLRNPFSLEVVDGRVFVADNGIGIDRFLEVEPGTNYLWDGTDWSVGLRAAAVISPSVGPVQMDRYSGDPALLPEEYAGKFLIATAGVPAAQGASSRRGTKGIMAVDYDLDAGLVQEVPTTLLRYRGTEYQSVVGLAVGPDGVYFVPLFADQAGQSAVLKITRDPDDPHPYALAEEASPQFILGEKGCYGCHLLDTRGYGVVGPPLDAPEMVPRLLERLHSPEYERSLRQLDAIEEEPFASYRTARADVLAAQGIDRVHTYIRYQLQEPRFDGTQAQMPTPGLSAEQAEMLAGYLLTGAVQQPSGRIGQVVAFLASAVPRSRVRVATIAFGGGVAAGVVLVAFVWVLARRYRRANRPSTDPPHCSLAGRTSTTDAR